MSKHIIKAFHPKTVGVIYHCEIVNINTNDTARVHFHIDGKSYTIPLNHVTVNGEFADSEQVKYQAELKATKGTLQGGVKRHTSSPMSYEETLNWLYAVKPNNNDYAVTITLA